MKHYGKKAAWWEHGPCAQLIALCVNSSVLNMSHVCSATALSFGSVYQLRSTEKFRERNHRFTSWMSRMVLAVIDLTLGSRKWIKHGVCFGLQCFSVDLSCWTESLNYRNPQVCPWCLGKEEENNHWKRFEPDTHLTQRFLFGWLGFFFLFLADFFIVGVKTNQTKQTGRCSDSDSVSRRVGVKALRGFSVQFTMASGLNPTESKVLC